MSCPKCGSDDVVIIAGDVLKFRCRSCGNTWVVEVRQGMVMTKRGPLHWTEVTYLKERALDKARDLALRGRRCSEIVDELSKEFGDVLFEKDIRAAARKGIIHALDTAKLKDESLYRMLLEELERC